MSNKFSSCLHFLFVFCMVIATGASSHLAADDFSDAAMEGQNFGRSAAAAFDVNMIKTGDDGTIQLPEMVCIAHDANGNCTKTEFRETTTQVICLEPEGETDMALCTRTGFANPNTSVDVKSLFPGTSEGANPDEYFADPHSIDDLKAIDSVDQFDAKGKTAKESLFADAMQETPTTLQGNVYGVMIEMMDKPRLDVKNDPALDTSRKIFENAEQLESLVGDCRQITEYIESTAEYRIPDYKVCTRPIDKSAECKINHEINSHNEPATLPIQIKVRGWDNEDYRSCALDIRNPETGETLQLPVTRRDGDDTGRDSYFYDCAYDTNQALLDPQTTEWIEAAAAFRSMGYVPATTEATPESPINFDLWSCRSKRNIIDECYNEWQDRTVNVVKTIVDLETWSPESCIESAKGIYDKFATGTLTCSAHYQADPINPDCALVPTTNNSGQGYICKDQLKAPPYSDLDPFCAQYDVKVDYTWFEGAAPCYTDIFGNEVCPSVSGGTAVSTCGQYENNPQCKLHKQNGCVEGTMAADGTCYESEEIWDCGETKTETDYIPVTRVECTGSSSCGLYEPATQLADQKLQVCTKEVKQQEECTSHHKINIIATNNSVAMKVDGRVSFGWFGAPDRWTIVIKNPATGQQVEIAVRYSNQDLSVHPLGISKADFSVTNLALSVNYLIASQGALPPPFDTDWIPQLAAIGFPIDTRALVREDGSLIYDENFPINFRFDQSLMDAIFGSGVDRIFEYQTTSIAESYEPQECTDTYEEGMQLQEQNVANVSTQCVAEYPVNDEGCLFVDHQAACNPELEPSPFADISPTCERISVKVEYENNSDALDGCKALEESNACGFISSTCIERNPVNQQCTKYEKTYDCGGTEAVAPSEDPMAEPESCQIRCMGEECVQPVRTQSDSFNEAVAALNAAQYAVQDMDCSNGKDNCRVFAGQPLGCTFVPDIAGFQAVNCCDMPSSGSSMQQFIAAGQLVAQVDKAMMAMETSNGAITSYQNISSAISGQYTATMDAVTAPFNGVKESIDAGAEVAQQFVEDMLKDFKQEISEQLGTTAKDAALQGAGEGGASAATKEAMADNAQTQARDALTSQVKGAINLVATAYMYYQMTMLAIQLAFPCEEESYMLQAKKDMNLCHVVGTYCEESTEDSIGVSICVLKKTNYCCYNSILGKIVNEQGLPQLGRGFGSKENPECEGFKIEDFSRLDFQAMDLSEWIGTLQDNNLMPTPDSMTIEKLTGSEHAFSELDPENPRPDVVTRADSRMRDEEGNPLPFTDLRKDAAESTFLDPR